MKHVSEYRDPELAAGLLQGIRERAARIQAHVSIMEVCGTHTHAIGNFGIRQALPENVELVSGPGCPVCVTSIPDVDAALYLAQKEGVVFASFGDMLKVPGSGGNSLENLRAGGADVRIVSSPLDCIQLARENPDREVVFMGIGFETTAPTVAATVQAAARQEVGNFSVYPVHKLMPPVLSVLLQDPELRIDALLCPGHVSVVTGSSAYAEVVESGRAAVIGGFEPLDVLESIYMILGQIENRDRMIEIQYKRGVKEQGNLQAKKIMEQVFVPDRANWRGLGSIPASGLSFRSEYQGFDALSKFAVPEMSSEEPRGCLCGEILKGKAKPPDCPLYKVKCTPASPFGPCMVSGEGTCSAYYKYH